jgi:hypothetical protein
MSHVCEKDEVFVFGSNLAGRHGTGEPETALFASAEELLAIPWVAFWRTFDGEWPFYRFSLDCSRLLAEYDKGAAWQLVGTMSGAAELLTSLPSWRPVERSES